MVDHQAHTTLIAIAAVGVLVSLLGCGPNPQSPRDHIADRTNFTPANVTSSECASYTGPILQTEWFKGYCGHGPIEITKARDWERFVERCMTSGHEQLPDIDFHREVVRGVVVDLSCPYENGYAVSTRQTCGNVLYVEATINRDFCYCDYLTKAVHLFVVPKDTISLLIYEERDTPGCEEVTCLCPDGAVSACEAFETMRACYTLPPCEN